MSCVGACSHSRHLRTGHDCPRRISHRSADSSPKILRQQRGTQLANDEGQDNDGLSYNPATTKSHTLTSKAPGRDQLPVRT